MKYSWGTNRRFNAASNQIKKTFGTRVQKVTIDAGFTCPNRDGTKATGGCTFCNNEAFSPSYCSPEKSVAQQLTEGIEFHEKRYKAAGKYVAYFQAFSNTYGSVEHLDKLYQEALNVPNVVGLIIGTRPDCIDNDILELLSEYASKTHLVVEFGIESVYNKTLETINRGHTYEEAVHTINLCAKRGINTGAHIIFGLPGETLEMMLNSASILSKLPIRSIKFHQLQIIKGTKIGDDFMANPERYKLFSIDEYASFIVDYLSYLNPEFMVERLAGETQPWRNLGKHWNLRYDQVLNIIEKKLDEKDLWQGKYFKQTVN